MIVPERLKKLEKENADLKKKLKEARYINTGILRRWKADYKKTHLLSQEKENGK